MNGLFKQIISKNFRSCTIQVLLQRLTDNQTLSLQYPNITKLLTIALTLPALTVSVNLAGTISLKHDYDLVC